MIARVTLGSGRAVTAAPCVLLPGGGIAFPDGKRGAQRIRRTTNRRRRRRTNRLMDRSRSTSAGPERAPSTPVRSGSKAGRRWNTCSRASRSLRDAVLPPVQASWFRQACRNGWSEGSGIAEARCRSPATVAREVCRPGHGAVCLHVGAAWPYSLRRLPDCRAEATGYAGDGLGSAAPPVGKLGIFL